MSTKSLRIMMNLPKMIFNNLGNEDQFGMKVIKNGYNQREVRYRQRKHVRADDNNSGNCDPKYLENILKLEDKDMNERIKVKYFDDLTDEMINRQKTNRSMRLNSRQIILKNHEMEIQTQLAIKDTIEEFRSIFEYEVEKISDMPIMGPVKWLVIIVGPNHRV